MFMALVICVAIVVVQRMRSRSIFRSTETLAHNEDVDSSVIVAAYNPANGAMYNNGDYHESVTNLAKSASMHSNVNGGDSGGLMVVEADIVTQVPMPMPVIDEDGVS